MTDKNGRPHFENAKTLRILIIVSLFNRVNYLFFCYFLLENCLKRGFLIVPKTLTNLLL